MRFALALATLAAAGFAAPPAFAQYYHYGPPAYEAPYWYRPGPVSYCRKLCPQDVTPCDPPAFKKADGRCNGAVGGSIR
ncbi:MAG: hypothetical protein KGM42_16700 [Hyphomicrobiales bacterium]|nr:hypothetical protein [Hyphomicrobiales bacterium]